MRGFTKTEIGQTMPYSGPVSAFGALGKGEVGYFKMLNERGGINGQQDQPDLARRQLRAAEDGGADAAAVPVDQMQFMRFNGKTWVGELLTGN